MRFIGRRLAFYVITLWAAVTINFFIPRLMPGDPVKALIAKNQGRISTDAMDSLYALFGLDVTVNPFVDADRVSTAKLLAKR